MFISLNTLFSCESEFFGYRCASDDFRLYEKELVFSILSREDSPTLTGWYTAYQGETLESTTYYDIVDYILDLNGDIILSFIRRGEEDFVTLNQQSYYIHFGQDDTDTLK